MSSWYFTIFVPLFILFFSFFIYMISIRVKILLVLRERFPEETEKIAGKKGFHTGVNLWMHQEATKKLTDTDPHLAELHKKYLKLSKYWFITVVIVFVGGLFMGLTLLVVKNMP